MTFTEDEGVLPTHNGRTIGWIVRGPASGQIVGWLHGQPGSRRDVRAISEATLTRLGIRLMAIDRAGYGDTSPAGMDRRAVAQDVLTVADHLGVDRFPVIAVSMGGVYALALAASAPERISKIVLASGHVLPYDDPAIVAGLSTAEQDDVAMLRRGPSPELEAAYAEAAASTTKDPHGLLRELAAHWGAREQALVETPFMSAVAESVAFGLAGGHTGYLEDGLRTVRPLDFDLAAVRCPVRAIHGTADDLEPYANLERLAPRISDCVIVALPGLGHFGPWLWPDIVFALLMGD